MTIRSATHILATAFFVVYLTGSAFTQESADRTRSLGQRLKSVTHVGLRMNPQTFTYTAMLYSADEAKERISRQEEEQTKEQSSREQIESLQRQLQEARASNTSQTDVNLLMRDLTQAQRRMAGMSLQESMYRVVEVGSDFIELQSLSEQDEIVILPFQRIGRIVSKKPAEAKQTNG